MQDQRSAWDRRNRRVASASRARSSRRSSGPAWTTWHAKGPGSRRDSITRRPEPDESAAEEVRQDAIRRYCAQAIRGLGKLDLQGRQRLLQTLIDQVVLKDRALETHGVLPGRRMPGLARNRAQGQQVVPNYEPRGYVLLVPIVSTESSDAGG